MLLKGVSLHDCGKKFGRDFILHYRQIKDYLCDVMLWENDQIKDFDGLIVQQDIIALEKANRLENARNGRL